MNSENRILTIEINSETKVVHSQPENHYFLTKHGSPTPCNTALHETIKTELYEYYLKQSYRVQSSNELGSYPAEIILIDGINHLVQLHYKKQVVNHFDLRTILYFNFINIDSYSKGRNLSGSYLEDKAIEMQLAAALEEVNLLSSQTEDWVTEETNLFNKL